MKQIDLWNIYYMATNAALDVWTQEDFLQGKITQNQVNQQKLRLTFPIKWLRTLASGEKLYLVCQLIFE